MGHSILLRDFALDRLDTVTRAVSQAYQVPVVDARNKVRRGWGFLERDVASGTAEQIVTKLKANGVDAFAVANDALRRAGEPKLLKGLQPDSEGCLPQWQSPQGGPERIQWSEIEIVAAAGLSEEIVRREAGGSDPQLSKMVVSLGLFMATGLPMSMLTGAKAESVKQVKSNRYIMFGRLITVRGEQYAFNPDHFDFSGLGNLKQLNVSLNFRALITVLSKLTRARFNYGARLLLDQKPLTLANYQSLHDLENEMLWLLNAQPAGQSFW